MCSHCSLKHRFSPRGYCYDLCRIISFVLVQPQWAHRRLQDADIACGPCISHHNGTQWGNVLGLGQSSIGGTCKKKTLIQCRNESGESHYISCCSQIIQIWLRSLSGQLTFPKTIIFPEWDLFCLVQQYHESSPKFPPVPISSWALQDKIGAQWEKCLPNYAKLILIFLNTFFWTIQPSGLLIETFHNTSCPLPTIEVAFFTSLSSFIEEPNTAQRLHGSAQEAWPVSVFCAPLSCSPFTFTGVWCLCAKNSVHKRFLKPSQTMPANNLFWTNPMLSHGHYQLKLKYDLLYM